MDDMNRPVFLPSGFSNEISINMTISVLCLILAFFVFPNEINFYAQKGTYDANFLEAFSGSEALIKPDSTVSANILEANETLFLAMLNRLRMD